MAYRWKPNATQKQEYHKRMVAIESIKEFLPTNEYSIKCTGDCCSGDEISFFNAGKTDTVLYGKIIKESYGSLKQQHTFTIMIDSVQVKIKGRNLYKNGVYRKQWADEKERERVIAEKHQRGSAARGIASDRKSSFNSNLY